MIDKGLALFAFRTVCWSADNDVGVAVGVHIPSRCHRPAEMGSAVIALDDPIRGEVKACGRAVKHVDLPLGVLQLLYWMAPTMMSE